MMTKEDVLRELELLPVWQLRTPQPNANEGTAEKTEKTVEAVQTIERQAIVSESVKSVDKTFRVIVSEDASWVFALDEECNAEAETLLQNMLKAVSIKVKEDSQTTLTALAPHQPKVIVAMGDAVAQALLEINDTVEVLRKKTQYHEDVAVVVTYSPQHLLQNLTDKAKAWEDLCLAKFTVSSLASE